MGEDPLALETRRRLLSAVEATPGLSAREIQREAGTAWGETAYHLDRLESAGLLHRERGSRQDFYFSTRVPLGDRTLLRMARSPAVRRILVELLSEPELTLRELAQHCALSLSRTSIHLRRLLETGLVSAGRRGQYRAFRVSDPHRVGKLLVSHREGYADRAVDLFVDTWGELFPP